MRTCECRTDCDTRLHPNYPGRYMRGHSPERVVTSRARDAIEVDCPRCGETWQSTPVVAHLIATDGCSKCWLRRARRKRRERRE